MKMMKKLADSALDMLLKTVDAGACVPNQGDYCYCKSHRQYTVSCTGPCKQTSLYC